MGGKKCRRGKAAQEADLNEIIKLFQCWSTANARFRPINRSDSSWKRPPHLAVSYGSQQTERLIGANQQLIAVLQLQVGVLSFHQRLDDLARSGDAHHLTTEAESLRRVFDEQARQNKDGCRQPAARNPSRSSFLANPGNDRSQFASPAVME